MDPNLRGVVFIVYFKQFYVFEDIRKIEKSDCNIVHLHKDIYSDMYFHTF